MEPDDSDLEAGFASTPAIAQAVGVLMARRDCDADAAFTVLSEIADGHESMLEAALEVLSGARDN